MASLLDTALSRITGAPGESANAPIAPKQSFGEFLNPYMTESQTTQTTPNFDPAAESAAKFATDMAAIQAPTASPTAAATAEPVRNSAGLTQQEFTDAINKSVAATPGIIEPDKFKAGAIAGQFSTPENWSNYYSMTGLTGNALDAAVNQSVAGSTMQQRSGTTEPYSLSVIPPGGATAAPKPAMTKPTNPGPRAPWQASAQYWRDLDAYKKAGGV